MKSLLIRAALFLSIFFIYNQSFSQYRPNYRAARHPFDLGGTFKKAYKLANEQKNDSAYIVMRGLADSLLAEENWKDYLKARNELATLYIQHNKPNKTIEILDETTKNIKPHISPLSTEMVYTYKIYWFAYRYFNDLEKLKEVQDFRLYQVENRKEEHDKTGHDFSLDVDTYDEISISYAQTGQMEKYYYTTEKAFEVAERIEWPSRVNQLYANLATTMFEDGYYDYAEDFVKQALQSNNLTNSYDSAMAVYDYSTVSSIYRNKKEYKKSLESLDFSSNILKESLVPFRTFNGVNDKERGHTYKKMGKLDSAIHYYKIAARKLLKHKNFSGAIESYINLAGLYEKNYNKLDSAEKYIAEAKAVMQSNSSVDRNITEIYYTHLADFYREQGEEKKAIQFAHKGLLSLGDSSLADTNRFLAPKISLNTIRIATLTLYEAKIEALIGLFEKTDHPDELNILEEHFKQYDKYFLIFMNENTNKKKIKNSLASYRNTLDMVIDFYHSSSHLKPGDKKTLFALISRGKGIEMLIEKHQVEFNKLIEKRDTSDFDFMKTKDRIFTIENQLEILDKEENADTIKALNNELVRLRRIAILKEAQLKYKAHQNIETIAFGEIEPSNTQKRLDANEAILEYHITDKFIHVNSITKEEYEHFAVDLENIGQKISNVYRSIKTGENEIKELSELYELLIKPAEQSIKDKKELIVVADKKLNEIPFELFRENDNYLLKNYAVSYAYASSLIHSDSGEDATFDSQLLGVAPVFDLESQSVAMKADYRNIFEKDPDIFRQGSDQLKSLPYTKTEIEEIAKIFKDNKEKATLLYRNNAQKENLVQHLSKARIIHIATHGLLNKSNPYLSGLALYPDSDTMDRNDVFYHYELYDMEVDADLVVLSACKTGTGEIVEGEGVMALPRGFIHAGVPNVVASLWKVHDEKTKALMVAFYKHLLQDNVSYSEALRQAKLDCIEKGYLPLDWAGFVLIGN